MENRLSHETSEFRGIARLHKMGDKYGEFQENVARK